MRDGTPRAGRGCISGYSIKAALLASVALGLVAGIAAPAPAYAQGARAPAVSLNIRSQDLGPALTTFADRAGLRLLFPSSIVAGKTSPALSGSFTREEALGRLLAGSGLTYSFTDANTVTIIDRFAAAHDGSIAADGSLVLDVIDVNAGRGGGNPADIPYETPGSSAYISGESLERFRGMSAGDFLRGTPGVLTGASTEKGALDLNIRGMQGMDRVPIVLDGTRQSQTVYEGYAGVSTRTYIDPDLLGDVVIEKGPSAAADAVGATGGVARMRTIDAGDILGEGESIALRVTAGATGNTVAPPPATTRGGIYQHALDSYPTDGLPTDWGNGNFDRPSLLDFQSFNGSVALAARNDTFEVLAAYARRKQGNYFAGTKGDPGYVLLTPQSGGNVLATQEGLGPYRAGEEVLNSGFDNTSLLLKGRINFGESHTLDLSYMNFESELSEMPWPGLTGISGGQYQATPSISETGTYKAGYHWDPEGDAVDLNVNLWATTSFLTQEVLYLAPAPLDVPLLEFAYLFDSKRWGVDADNTSRFHGAFGDLSVQYGASFTHEDLLQIGVVRSFEAPNEPDRSGTRDEASAFISSKWSPTDWFQLEMALRYTHTLTVDDCISVNATTCFGERRADGLSPIVAVTLEPWEGVQVYGRYAEATRSPSLFESTAGASFGANGLGLKPEHARNSEVGINLLRHDLLVDGDTLGFKFAYFDNRIDDYLTRRAGGIGEPVSVLTNLDYARFAGIEIAANYDNGVVFGSLGYTRYLDTEFCGDISLNRYRCGEAGGSDSYVGMHLPPGETFSLTAGIRLFEALTLGARATYIGERVVQESHPSWTPHTLVDLFATYEFSKDVKLNVGIDNVGDVFYVNPLSILPKPGPGRTVRASLMATF